MIERKKSEDALVFQIAVNEMRNVAFLKTPRYQEQQTRAKLAGAHPDIVDFSRKLVKKAAGLGIPLFPHCIVRTYDDQASAFVKGNSRDSPEDGLWPHRFAAVDIIHGVHGWFTNDSVPTSAPRDMWAIIGHLGKEVAHSMSIDIEWGGDWSFYDPAHFELVGWKDMDPHSFEPIKRP